jgi:DNA processing protein
VVEAAEGSGSLITARDALDQGREVLAVPGHPLDPRAAGCNLLIRDGARLIRSVADVAEALGPGIVAAPRAATPRPAVTVPAAARAAATRPATSGPVRRPAPAVPRSDTIPPADPARLHDRILSALGPSPVAEDQLLRDLALPPTAAAPALLFLELAGKIRREPGGLLALA